MSAISIQRFGLDVPGMFPAMSFADVLVKFKDPGQKDHVDLRLVPLFVPDKQWVAPWTFRC